MRREALYTLLLIVALCTANGVEAQHTVGFNVGTGMATGRFEPTQETKPIFGNFTAGFSWRYYSSQRIVGGIGADLEFIQQGFQIATNTSRVDDPKDYLYYARHVNSLMLPFVWQPHAYIKRRVRIYGEAGVTFSYNISSTYSMERMVDDIKFTEEGDYHFKTPRDNRWGYGLLGGGGVAVLIKQLEINIRARYYFGYSDILRSRNKYSSSIEGFTLTPLRSPMDNLMITIGVNYRFNKEGFESWKPRRKRPKMDRNFEYGDGPSGGSTSISRSQGLTR